MSDRESACPTARLGEAAYAAGWVQTRTPPAAPLLPGTAVPGVWNAPDGAAQLAVGDPDPDRCPVPDQPCARVALTGGRGARRPWAITGHCPVIVLPDLVAAASLPPGATDVDPPSLLPSGLYFREVDPGCPRGRYREERWLDWGWGADYMPMLTELVFFLPGSTSAPDTLGGWCLVLAGPNYATLHADLATPRHIVAALVAAVSCRGYEHV